jgi:hypothetical protein
MVTDFGVSARNVKRGDVKAEDAGKPPASISACQSGSDDFAKPAGCDTTCHNGGAQQEVESCDQYVL